MITADPAEQAEMLAWAAKQSGCIGYAGDAVAIGIRGDDGALRGVVVFDQETPTTVHMHVASDGSRRWLTREMLFVVFGHAFHSLGKRTALAQVPASMGSVMMFDRKIGFRDVGIIPDGCPGGDLVLMAMRKRECRFIPAAWRV